MKVLLPSLLLEITVCIVRGPCTCPKADIHRVDQEWSITDQNKGARTIQSITDASRLPARSKKKFNCSKVPLFSMVPMERVIIDNLHLFLRVADNLINLLILDLRRLDGIEKCNELDRSKATNIREYEAFLVFSCKDSRFLKWRDLLDLKGTSYLLKFICLIFFLICLMHLSSRIYGCSLWP